MAKSQLRISPALYQTLPTTKVHFEELLGQQVFKNLLFNLLEAFRPYFHLYLLRYF